MPHIPISPGAPGELRQVRDFFKACGYSEQAAVARLGLHTLSDILLDPPEPGVLTKAADSLDLVIRLFLTGDSAEESALACLPETARLAIASARLLQQDPAGLWCAPVALYPIGPLYIASDRWVAVHGAPWNPPRDIVYAALTANTMCFLGSLPGEPCDRLLDLCSGTGIGALLGTASGARHTWAVDLSERCSDYARFNCALNGIDGLTIATGDLYEPLGDATFDRIVAHPPYVPSLRPSWVFLDGGEDGEQVTRHIIEGLPRRLESGGRLYCETMAAERSSEPFEARIRRWLGAAQAEFDVLVVVRFSKDPRQFALDSAFQIERRLGAFRDMEKHLRQLGVESLLQCFVVIQRKTSDRPAFTLRRDGVLRPLREAVAWLMQWQAASAGSEARRLLLETKLKAAPGVDLNVTHRLRNGDFVPTEFHLRTGSPLPMEARVEPWLAVVLNRCTGALTGRELFEFARTNALLDPATALEHFLDLLADLVSRGFLELDDFRLPAAAE